MFWSDIIELLRALILSVAQVCNGSVGTAVILVSLAIRLALLPVTLRLARRAQEHRRRLDELKPQVERLQQRYANDPARAWRETAKFYENRGVRPFDSAGLLGGLAQAPIFMAMYSALRNGLGSGIRFLWVSDTALPNVLLSLLVANMTILSMASGPAMPAARAVQTLMFLMMGAMTLWFLSSTSALVALSTGAGSLVGVLQNRLLLRGDRTKGTT